MSWPIRRLLLSLFALFVPAVGLLIGGCVPQTGQAPQASAAAELIPRQLVFGNPDKSTVRISPDGTRISYRAAVDGVMNVWVGPIDDPAAAKPVTHDTNRGIRRYFWAYTNRHIIYLKDAAGDENWRVYSVDLETGDEVDLTPIENVQVRIQQVSHRTPQEVLVAINQRDPSKHDVYRLDIGSGEMSLVEENLGFVGFVSDDDYEIRLATAMTPDGGMEIHRKGDDGWENFLQVPQEDTLNTGPIGFDRTGTVCYMNDSRGRNTSALVALDLLTGETEVLYEDPRADVDNVLVHPVDLTVQAVASTYERREWKILDDSIAADLEYLSGVADGEINVLARSQDDRRWVVGYDLASEPYAYYLYDRDEGEAKYLFTHRGALEEASLAGMQAAIIPARDGLDLVSYYSLPVGSDTDGDGRPENPMATVLLVHGGPWGRDAWGFNSEHQWLANRGYAVLSVNFRGSTGLGKSFTNAGDREWGRKMHDDLLDAVDWAAGQGITDPERVAIMGGSYGGYATLAGLTLTPETFACGVDIVGPSNLITLMNSIPPYWKPLFEMFAARMGDPRTEEGRALLTERSPLTHVDKISRPLLIAQGANDPRVKQAESDQIVEAMRAKEIPVTYALFPDEGHGFARPENRLAFYAIAEAFLADCLGGTVEPIGDDLEGSSIQVPAGAEQIAGLQGLLEAPAPQEAEVAEAAE